VSRLGALIAFLAALFIGVPLAGGAAKDPPPPPTIDLTSVPANPTSQTSASFVFSDTDPTVVGFQCQLDSGGYSDCTSPQPYSNLPDGSHTFEVKAVDKDQEASDAAPYTWTVDATAPTGSLDINGGAEFTGSTTVTLNLHASDGTGSGIAAYRIADGINCSSASFVTVSPPISPYDADVSHTLPSGDGPKTVCVEYKDAAGNLTSVPPASIILDTENPIAKVDSGPHDPTNQTSATFTFSSSKNGSTFRCRLDGGGFSSCTSPKVYPGPLADGPHTFSVRATYLGNEGPRTDYTWTIDTIPPETTIASTPPPSSSSAGASFTFTSSEAGSTFACSLDAGGFTPCASPQTYTGLGDGTHTFRVQAIDAAGNADTTPPAYSWQIVGVGPSTTDRTPPGDVKRLTRNVRYGMLKLAWTRPSDVDFDHVTVLVSTNPKSPPRTMVYKGTSRTYTNRRFKNGLYYRYAVVSYDHTGNASRGSGVVVPASALLRSPRDGAFVTSPPRLRWASVPGASFYNVQLYSPRAKLLSAWPGKAALTLRRRWTYAGRRFALKKGLYRWFVWPGFGSRSKGRYGQLLGQGTFRVR
jgi:hypothetical protein